MRFLLVALLAGCSPAIAESGDVDRPCGASSAAHADARKKIERLDARIRRLEATDDHVPANDALIALLEHPCLKLAGATVDELRAEAAPALIDFWKRGGRRWLRSHLALASTRQLVLRPPMPAVVAVETRRHHPMPAALCKLGDRACAAATRPWIRRAEAALATAGDGTELAACVKKAKTEPAPRRFTAWRDCVRDEGPSIGRMPLGGLKPLTSGWLILRGRRGHYSFCDEVRLYSLATGAAYVSQSCSRLALAAGGQVDGARTDAARKPAVTRGTIPSARVRELAWMLLQLGEVARGPRSKRYRLPAGIEPRMPSGLRSYNLGGSWTMSSNQTTLAWALIEGRKVRTSGTLTWPNDYNDPARDHAVDLVRAAEAALARGCPKQRPPRLRHLGKARPHVSPVDADADELALLEGELVDAIGRSARGGCRQ